MPLQPLSDQPSLSQRAYQAIKDAILSLEIRPGEVLSIGNLADLFTISRTPVRDALLLLEKDGLVTILPHKGAQVTEISRQDVREIFEMRIALESYAAKVAVTRLTAEDRHELESILQRSGEAYARHEYVHSSDLARQLHDLLVQKLDNRRFTSYLDELDTHYTRFRRLSVFVPGRFEKSYQQHLEILKALQEGNGEVAERVMADHLASVCADILASIDDWLNEVNKGVQGTAPETMAGARPDSSNNSL